MTSLLTLLGAVLCSLAVSSEVIPPADFNLQAMAGKWYLIGFATNAQWFVTRKGSMKMGMAILTPTADGDMEISYSSLNSDGSCWRMNNLATKTKVPGKFTYTSQRKRTTYKPNAQFNPYFCFQFIRSALVPLSGWGNKNDMRVVDVKYDEYALTQTIKTKGDDATVVNKLYGTVTSSHNARLHPIDCSIVTQTVAD
uniref:Lipocalin-like n=1 Tax=Stegastes partitus TaxID=144197 RepID=A0A3B4Z8X5_9TELE